MSTPLTFTIQFEVGPPGASLALDQINKSLTSIGLQAKVTQQSFGGLVDQFGKPLREAAESSKAAAAGTETHANSIHHLKREALESFGAISFFTQSLVQMASDAGGGNAQLDKLSMSMSRGISAGFGIASTMAMMGVATGGVTVAIGALVAVGLTLVNFLSNSAEKTKAEKEAMDDYKKSLEGATSAMLDQLIVAQQAEIDKLDALMKKRKEANQVPVAVGSSQFGPTSVAPRPDSGLAQLEKDVQAAKDKLDTLKQMEKQSALTTYQVQKMAADLTVAAVKDKYDRQRAEAAKTFFEQMDQIASSTASEKERFAAEELARQGFVVKSGEIDQQQHDEAEQKLKQETEQRKAELEKWANDYKQWCDKKAALDLETALAGATSVAEESRIKREFLQGQIADLENLGVRTMEQETRLLELKTALSKEESDENKRLRAQSMEEEQKLMDLQAVAVQNDHQRAIEEIKAKYQKERDLAKNNAVLLEAINKAQNAEINREDKKQQLLDRQKWEEEHRYGMIAINALGDGIREFGNQFLLVHREAKDEADAVWIAIENAAITALMNIIAQAATDAIIGNAIKAGQTASTVAMMGTILAVSGPAALAVNIASFGSAGYAAASSSMTAAAALAAGMKSVAIPFARGGEIHKGEVGYFEGLQTEYVIPRRSMEQIIQEDLVPMLMATPGYRNAQNTSVSGYDFRRLEARLDRMQRTLATKQWSPVFENFSRDERIIAKNLTKAEQIRASRKR